MSVQHCYGGEEEFMKIMRRTLMYLKNGKASGADGVSEEVKSGC